MGLVILPVAFFIALVWLAVTLAAAVGAWRVLRKLPYGRAWGLLASCLIFFLSWWLPNMEGIRQQRELEGLKADCGWTVYGKAQGVEGIYVESRDAHSTSIRFGPLLRKYKTLEYLEPDGKVVHLENAGQATPTRTYIPFRTQRYSLVEKTSVVGSFRREEAVLFDHQANQLLAKDVEYWPNESSGERTVAQYAMRALLVQPDICQSIIHPNLNERIAQVAMPEQGSK